MSSANDAHDRSRLDGCEIELFELVKKRATPEQWKEWLRTPLEHVAAEGNVDLFTRLMDAGADGSAGWRGCDGRTLLCAAARGKNEGMISALLEAGAGDDVNVFFGDETVRRTALHEAAFQGAESVAEVLLFAGADPNLLDGMNRSPLHLAAFRLHHGTVGKLLQNGALPNATTIPDQVSSLHLCLTRDDALGVNDSDSRSARCVSELLAGGADKDVVTDSGETPLCRAVVYQYPEAVELLLAAGSDTSLVPDHIGFSLVGCAAAGNSLGILESLLQHGCDVNGRVGEGPVALHLAANKCETGDNIRALLDAGADTEARTDPENHHYYVDGFSESHLTPLHIAALEGSSTSTLRALVEGGANVHARNAAGRTALHIACRSAHGEDVEILLSSGADETLKDSQGATAVDLVGDMLVWDYVEEDVRAMEIENQHIREMLARVPADRAWRRRRWLVLCRSCPTRVHLAENGGNRARSATESGAGGEGSSGAAWDEIDGDLANLVGTLIGVKEEGLFRLVVGFL